MSEDTLIKGSRRRKQLVIVASIVAVVAALWLLKWWLPEFSKSVVPGAQIGRTSSTEFVELAVVASTGESLKLRLPKSYLVLRENWKGGPQTAIWIEAALPEMKPARAIPKLVGSLGSPEYERSLTAMNNGVWLSLESQGRDIARALGNIRRNLTNTERVHGTPRAFEMAADTRYGLQPFREKRCWLVQEQRPGAGVSLEHCVDNLSDHYLPASGDDPPVYIVCDLSIAGYLGPRVGCDVTAEYRGFALTYRFKESQLNRWREFDEAVRGMLDELVVDAKPPS